MTIKIIATAWVVTLLVLAAAILAGPQINSFFHNLDGHQHSDQSTWKPLNNGYPGWSNRIQPW